MAYTQVTGNRTARTAVILAAVAVLVLAALGGGYLLGHNSSTGTAPSAAVVPAVLGQALVPASKSGPARIVGGIPSGYTDDRDGAISAGVGFLQTGAMVDSGRVTPAAAAAQVLSGHPSAAAVTFVHPTIDPTPTAGIEQVYGDAPVAVKVMMFTPAAAQLSFWSCFTGGTANAVGLPVVGFTSCTLENVALSWERGDWKAADYQGLSKPPAGMSVTSLVHDQGYHVLAGAFTVLTVAQP